MARIEHEDIKELKQQILKKIGRHLDLSTHQVFFFGSRVTGKGDAHSDIDIGILGPKAIPLHLMAEIKEVAQELPVLYKIDIVDFNSTSKKFKKVALEKIENF